MDRRIREVIGLPVVTFNRGSKVYSVEDAIIDPERRQVLALLVAESSLFHSARAVPFGRINAIGNDAVIVPDGKAVIDVNRDPVLRRLYNNHTVRGLSVLTEDGRKLGQVADMQIDDKTGEVKGYYVSIGRVLNVTQGQRWIAADRVLNVGLRVLYVPAEVGKEFDEQMGGIAGALDQAGASARTAGARLNTQLVQLGEQARSALPQRAGSALVGRTAHETVTAPDGTVIANSGDVITQEQVDASQAAGRLPQLMLAVGAGPARQHAESFNTQASQSWNDMRDQATDLWGRLTGGYGRIVDQADSQAVQRRIRFALGRPVSRVILDGDDNIILNTGDIITNRAVQAAREAGVLDQLVESVYVERPKLSADALKAPWRGVASLEGTASTSGLQPSEGNVAPDMSAAGPPPTVTPVSFGRSDQAAVDTAATGSEAASEVATTPVAPVAPAANTATTAATTTTTTEAASDTTELPVTPAPRNAGNTGTGIDNQGA